MAHIAVTDRKGKVECIFSIPDIYHYKGFYKVVDECSELNKEEREATRW